MPVPPRACLRCIERKKKCDHKQPQCGLCRRTSSVCEYPLPQQRRGPLGGFSRLAEERAVVCEDALAFLLAQPQVRACLADIDGKDHAIPQILDRNLSKELRSAWWTGHPLTSILDLLSYPTSTPPPSSAPEYNSVAVRVKRPRLQSAERMVETDPALLNDQAFLHRNNRLSVSRPSTSNPASACETLQHMDFATIFRNRVARAK